ncbi:MerR family transcriptional regulator [Planomonospora alba]
MAELSRETGVSVPMIKFYLREGLLPGGERTSPNQARYGAAHVRRIKLLRAMAEYGGLSLADIRALLARLDEPGGGLHERLGAAQRTVMPHREPGEGERWEAAARRAQELIARHGWRQHPDSPAMRAVTGVLASLDELGYEEMLTRLDAYAEAAGRIAQADVEAVASAPEVERMVEIVVACTPLGDTLVAALRRIAQSSISGRLFGEEGGKGEEGC